ncbi:F-actin-capping protein subunit alpha [Cimex lectularius]|uniref:F-actin-capping protein subunit alpha n=1 Tax=Cimex lectularius TaxID=79782 RepID=A0A8I6R937_CIMLE|nr:F-actin-capping protein subunit alpha [Cimex lectularius]
MTLDGEETISDQEKLKIVSNFILHSPPGEFNEVFNDARFLLNNDTLLKEGALGVFAQYCKDQLTPVKIKNGDFPVLITEHNDLGSNRYYDARTKQSFKYDPLRRETSNYDTWEPQVGTEKWRAALETELDEYIANHYTKGTCSVFSKKEDGKISLVACIEAHLFQPKNCWNGCWRSQWLVVFDSDTAQVKGVLKIQVHYYEDGNVQLVSSKEVVHSLNVSDEDQLAKDLVKIFEESEGDYQNAISDNYGTMSDTTFKALRRQLPVTRSKIDWSKMVSYSIGKELKPQ